MFETATPDTISVVKPVLRGWFHAIAAVMSLPVLAILLWRSRTDPVKALTLGIFGLSMIELYSISALYHIGNWSPRVKAILRTIDHANIFLFIAGTYTPLTINLLTGGWRITLIVLIWSLAAGGFIVAAFTTRLPRWLSPALYVAMGWVALLAFPAFVQAASWRLVLTLIGGGALYTSGALIYGRRWPNPSPRIFGFHEIFHLFIIAGSAVFFIAMFVWVLPAQRG